MRASSESAPPICRRSNCSSSPSCLTSCCTRSLKRPLCGIEIFFQRAGQLVVHLRDGRRAGFAGRPSIRWVSAWIRSTSTGRGLAAGPARRSAGHSGQTPRASGPRPDRPTVRRPCRDLRSSARAAGSSMHAVEQAAGAGRFIDGSGHDQNPSCLPPADVSAQIRSVNACPQVDLSIRRRRSKPGVR